MVEPQAEALGPGVEAQIEKNIEQIEKIAEGFGQKNKPKAAVDVAQAASSGQEATQ